MGLFLILYNKNENKEGKCIMNQLHKIMNIGLCCVEYRKNVAKKIVRNAFIFLKSLDLL